MKSIDIRFEGDVNVEYTIHYHNKPSESYHSCDESRITKDDTDEDVWETNNILWHYLTMMMQRVGGDYCDEDAVVTVENITTDGCYTSDTKIIVEKM